jgi:hypothetical protein
VAKPEHVRYFVPRGHRFFTPDRVIALAGVLVPVWDTYEAILDACESAWNALMRMPDRIASITRRSWAIPVIG